jgi:hypothetical protein
MESKGYGFAKPIRDYGVWKYIMAEGPDNMLLEIFQIVREAVPQDRWTGFSSLPGGETDGP